MSRGQYACFARLLCFSMSVPLLLVAPSHRRVFSTHLYHDPSSHAALLSRCSYYIPIHISLAVAGSSSHIRA